MKWLSNAWYVAMYACDLKVGKIEKRTILNNRLAIFRDAHGFPAAIEDRCPHRNAPLSMGHIEPDSGHLKCGYHGLVFEGSGKCVHNPHGEGKISQSMCVKSYPMVERHSLIWVWTGEQQADEDLIPDLSMFDPKVSKYMLGKADWLRMEVPWELITDNLLDLSHASFLHDGLLGNEDTVQADTVVSQEGNSVAVRRYIPDAPPPKMFDLMMHNDGTNLNMWNDVIWSPPGIFFLDIGCSAIGQSRESGTGNFAVHILTPETEDATIYHFMSARNNPLPRTPEEEADLAQQLAILRRTAFAEQDAPMIKAQHDTIRHYGGEIDAVLLSVDAGVSRWRRIMQRLVQEEELTVAV